MADSVRFFYSLLALPNPYAHDPMIAVYTELDLLPITHRADKINALLRERPAIRVVSSDENKSFTAAAAATAAGTTTTTTATAATSVGRRLVIVDESVYRLFLWRDVIVRLTVYELGWKEPAPITTARSGGSGGSGGGDSGNAGSSNRYLYIRRKHEFDSDAPIPEGVRPQHLTSHRRREVWNRFASEAPDLYDSVSHPYVVVPRR